MCGIVGYIGHREATPILLSGLKRLEYRGYDSAGVALLEELPRALASNGHSPEPLSGTQLVIEKCKGKVTDLEELAGKKAHHSTIGIGHTRWATHGAPSDVNAHPHTDQSGKIAVIHNGIIENYTQIKARLVARGHTFQTETDTEVLAHLIGEYYGEKNNLTEAVRLALNDVVGAYGIAVMAADNPDEIVAARKGSPLVLGIGNDGENFIASDARSE